MNIKLRVAAPFLAVALCGPAAAVNTHDGFAVVQEQLALRAKGCASDKLVAISTASLKTGADVVKDSKGQFKAEANARFLLYSGTSRTGTTATGLIGPMAANVDEAKLKRFVIGKMACDKSPPGAAAGAKPPATATGK
jgi:hypothetical protein